ncbi:MAG: hypothetical protein IJ661_07055 [Lachnospiraceae bacterium]|nr:hypothetical protein [Lachnospiraceae bacterium]
MIIYTYKEPVEAAQIIMDRMTMPDKPLYSSLFEGLSMCKEIGNIEQWADIIKKALSDEEYVVNAVLKYLKMNINEYVSDEVIKGIMPDVKRQFRSWLNKPLMCNSCKPPVQLDERGFCPKCHTGRSLPFAVFFDVFLLWDHLSLEEIYSYMEHPVSELSKAARRGMLAYLQKYPDLIQECIDAIKNNTYNARVFDVILKLPHQYVLPYKQEILEIANSDNHRCIIYFIRRLNRLEWIDESERKEYITRMIGHEDQDIRSEAMAAHLGEKTDRHIFDEVFYRE